MPVVTFPNAALAGVTTSFGVGDATPVPVSETCMALGVALLLMVIVPETEPTAVGFKVAVNVAV